MKKEFLSPSDVEKLKNSKRKIVDEGVDFEKEETLFEEVKETPTEKVSNPFTKTAKDVAGKVKIDYESEGRFDCPSFLHFSGYTVDHIDKFALVNEENIFETIVAILNELKSSNTDFIIENMLIEEFFETLISIKAQYNTITHIHRWICDCQKEEPENSRVINETLVDLSKLNYVSISQADEAYQNIYKEKFKDATIFDYYIKMKYGENSDMTEFSVDDEIKKMKVGEPFGVQNQINGDVYRFRFVRVGDLLEANNFVAKKYNSKIKAIKNKQIHNVKAQELKQIKQEELDKINQLKSQDFLRALKASSLVSKNNIQLTNIDEKMEVYKSIPIGCSIDLANFLDKIRFGVHQEQKFECPICGLSEGRWLQLEFNFIEFIPTKHDTSNGIQGITGGNIFMGV
jgi:hypothetical protein